MVSPQKLTEAQAQTIQNIKNKMVDVRKLLSTKRKAGGYTKISEILLMNVPAKIRMLEADFQDADVARIESTFKAVEEDLKIEYP